MVRVPRHLLNIGASYELIDNINLNWHTKYSDTVRDYGNVNAAGGKPENITGNIDIEGNPENLNNRLLDNCKPAARDNEYFSATLRMDYDVSDSVTLTSQTSSNSLDREQLVEADGTIYQNYESIQTGDIEVLFQELRLSGNFSNDGTWVVGANYERTETYDKFIATYGFSTAVPVQVFTLNPLCCNGLFNDQETDTMSIFGSMEYPIMDNLDLTLGIRYTDQERSYVSCGIDGGDGSWTNTGNEIQSLLQLLGGYDVEPLINLLDDEELSLIHI